MKRYRFKPQLIPTIFCLALLVILICLGSWQWRRADYKESLQQHYLAGLQSHILTLNDVASLGLDVQSYPISVTGELDNAHTFLLDNQNEGTKPGLHVITPLRIDESSVVLINRGWIALPTGNLGQARKLPQVESAREGLITLRGKIYFPSKKQFVLEADDYLQPRWPFLLQKLDMAAIETLLGKVGVGVELARFVIRLDPDQQVEQGEQLTRHWQFMVMGPEKHRAYSFQWFGMALALFVLYVIFSTEKIVPDEHS